MYKRQNAPARPPNPTPAPGGVGWGEVGGAGAPPPPGGGGGGASPLLHRRYRHNQLEVLQPHSVPLQMLAEVGLIGALLGLGALALLAAAGVNRVVKGTRAERGGIPAGGDHRYAAALLAAVAAWLVHMWFDWDWDIPGVAIPLFAMLGLLASRPRGLPGCSLTPARGG